MGGARTPGCEIAKSGIHDSETGESNPAQGTLPQVSAMSRPAVLIFTSGAYGRSMAMSHNYQANPVREGNQCAPTGLGPNDTGRFDHAALSYDNVELFANMPSS